MESDMSLSPGKLRKMKALSNQDGIIAAVAMDQRGSLLKSIAAARGTDKSAVTSAMMSEFKTAVAKVLSPHATAILIDPEYGLTAAGAHSPNCGLLLAYELSGYDNTQPGRMPDLIPNVSVLRIQEWGGNAVKLLVYYTPLEDAAINDRKHAFVERVGAECAALDIPLFLEVVGYDHTGGDEKALAYAKLKPRVVIGIMSEFSKPRYGADVLKVEVPILSPWIGAAYSRQEALNFFKAASDAASKPFIYLSAGVNNDVFLDQLSMAAESGAAYSGVLCGRATWKEGIPVYARQGVASLEQWLAGEGLRNLRRVNNAIKSARPWWEKGGLTATGVA
jgi:tagatose 1,6-diphosphate aldolase